MKQNICISDYDYPLPEERIAKFPLERREQSKLLLCRDGRVSEDRFFEVGKYLPEGSLLVFNNTKVIRARLVFYKETGARIEIFCLEPHDPADYERAFAAKESSEWSCIVGNLKKWKDGPLHIDFELSACSCRLSAEKVSAGEKEQIVRFRWDVDLSFGQLLETLGRIPIPPYLRRESEELDNSRYQTVYSKFEGSVAAPTAGLHFTDELLDRLRAKGVGIGFLTLHVGIGTFRPVKAENIEDHHMHSEHYWMPEETAQLIQDTKKQGGRVIAVGTTCCRTLESIARDHNGEICACSGWTDIFIYPGFSFRCIDGLITNFHLPESTLIMLVSAFYGYQQTMDAYKVAVKEKYRFFSFGDAMLVV